MRTLACLLFFYSCSIEACVVENNYLHGFGIGDDIKTIIQDLPGKLLSSKIDSLQVFDSLAKAENDMQKGALFSGLATVTSVIHYCEKMKYDYGIALGHKSLGQIYSIDPVNHPKSLEQTSIAIKMLKKLRRNDRLASCYLDLSLLYRFMNLPDSSLKYTYLALPLFDKSNYRGIASTFFEIAGVFEFIQQPDKELFNLKKAEFFMLLDTGERNMANIAILYNTMGSCYGRSRSKFALTYFLKAVDVCKKTKNMYMLAWSYANIASYYDDHNENDKAISYQRLALQIFETINNEGGIWEAANSLGQMLLKGGYYDQSLKYLKRAYLIASQQKDLNGLRKVDFSLYEFFKKKNSYKLALSYYEDYNKLVDTLNSDPSDLDKLKTALTADFKSREQLLIEKALNKDLKNEIRITNQTRFYIIMVFTLLFIILVVLVILIRRDLNRKLDTEKQLIALNEEKNRLVLEIQENERQIMAREIHDSAGASIVSIKTSLTNCLKMTNHRSLYTAIDANIIQVDRLANNLRNISHRMMPVALKEQGLGDSIEYLLKSLLSWTEIKYSFDNNIGSKRFDESIEIGLYRITEELLSNVLKHSYAKRVNVILYQVVANVVLMIDDDGIGFFNNYKKGLGLNSIELRLKQINGCMNFENRLPSGVITVVSIPSIPS